MFKFGFGLPALFLLFMLLKNYELLLYFIDFVDSFVLLIFLRASAYILAIPPYSMDLFIFFLSCYFLRCLAFRLFLSLFVFVFIYLSD